VSAKVQPGDRSHSVAEAERSGVPFLQFDDEAGTPQVIVLGSDWDSISVGRSRSSELALAWDDLVSRRHANIERAGDGWDVIDDGLSSNGTFVNEERVSGRRRLNDGDRLRFGRTSVLFRSPVPVPAPAAVPAASEPPAPRGPSAASEPPSRQRPPAATLSTNQRRALVALCRPYKEGNRFASPASDQQIADELVLSVGEVRGHLRVLCAKLGIDGQPAGQNRIRLAQRAFATGLVSEQDL
jgi:pSer/pThr/pTyr-binding forkhead associated (FHA) protein